MGIIAAYTRLAEMLNKKEEAEKYIDTAGEMAKEWEMAAYAVTITDWLWPTG